MLCPVWVYAVSSQAVCVCFSTGPGNQHQLEPEHDGPDAQVRRPVEHARHEMRRRNRNGREQQDLRRRRRLQRESRRLVEFLSHPVQDGFNGGRRPYRENAVQYDQTIKYEFKKKKKKQDNQD